MWTRVLVVDDEPTVTEVLGMYLHREGYDVSIAADGVEALRLARCGEPDLVLLDLMLPLVDGLEVCRQLRGETQVPIITLTARGGRNRPGCGTGDGRRRLRGQALQPTGASGQD